LRPRDGQGVAFSRDGRRIVASAATLAEPAVRRRTMPENLADSVVERIQIEGEEIYPGAAEWS